MKQTVTLSMFRSAFAQLRPDTFSYDGLEKLFAYFEDGERAYGQEIEFDVIEICCDWSEIKLTDLESETGCATVEELEDQTNVIVVDDETIIYGAF